MYAVVALDLDGAMLDAEAPVQQLPGTLEQSVGIIRAIGDEMRRERRFRGAEWPNVEIVDGFDALELSEGYFYLVDVDAGWNSRQRHPDRFLE